MTPVPTSAGAGVWSRHRRLLTGFVAGVAFCGIVGAVGGLATVEFGLYDASATAQHTRLVSWALHKTFKQAVRLRSPETPGQASYTQAQVIAGFRQYQTDCLACHGGPGVARGDWTKGLEPTPPFLLDAGERWSATELTYILEKGVKMSAMPSWGATRSPAQIAEIVAFLKALPGISPAQFSDWQRRYPAGPAPTEAMPDVGGSAPSPAAAKVSAHAVQGSPPRTS